MRPRKLCTAQEVAWAQVFPWFRQEPAPTQVFKDVRGRRFFLRFPGKPASTHILKNLLGRRFSGPILRGRRFPGKNVRARRSSGRNLRGHHASCFGGMRSPVTAILVAHTPPYTEHVLPPGQLACFGQLCAHPCGAGACRRAAGSARAEAGTLDHAWIAASHLGF